jgi:hypothetical protein
MYLGHTQYSADLIKCLVCITVFLESFHLLCAINYKL